MRTLSLALTITVLALVPLRVAADPPNWCDESPAMGYPCLTGCLDTETSSPSLSCFSGAGGGCCTTSTWTHYCEIDPEVWTPSHGPCGPGQTSQSSYDSGKFCCQGATTTSYACRPYEDCYGD